MGTIGDCKIIPIFAKRSLPRVLGNVSLASSLPGVIWKTYKRELRESNMKRLVSKNRNSPEKEWEMAGLLAKFGRRNCPHIPRAFYSQNRLLLGPVSGSRSLRAHLSLDLHCAKCGKVAIQALGYILWRETTSENYLRPGSGQPVSSAQEQLKKATTIKEKTAGPIIALKERTNTSFLQAVPCSKENRVLGSPYSCPPPEVQNNDLWRGNSSDTLKSFLDHLQKQHYWCVLKPPRPRSHARTLWKKKEVYLWASSRLWHPQLISSRRTIRSLPPEPMHESLS